MSPNQHITMIKPHIRNLDRKPQCLIVLCYMGEKKKCLYCYINALIYFLHCSIKYKNRLPVLIYDKHLLRKYSVSKNVNISMGVPSWYYNFKVSTSSPSLSRHYCNLPQMVFLYQFCFSIKNILIEKLN